MAGITIQGDSIIVQTDSGQQVFNIYTPEGFEALSALWIKSGWHNRYSYSFTWMGRPIIQLPEDTLRIQEIVFSLKPDVIIETGVAHGGSIIFYASLCQLMGKGHVVGVDIEIRPLNRREIEAHPMASRITLIEGDSAAPEIVNQVKSQVHPGDTVLILLDSNHTKAHVLAELKAYAPLVSVGSYIVATDGIMESLVGAPNAQDDWTWNNPAQAAQAFVQEFPDFAIEEPAFKFNQSDVRQRVTYWPSAFIKRLR
jgi:cephalosporin hydroxylase